MVLAIPAGLARTLLSDSRVIYANYETLVGAAAREPAPFADDSHRRAVSGAMFGSFAGRIIYGALSLTAQGLATYGDIFFRLRPRMIASRTSFLEENSFTFLDRQRTKASEPIAPGYRAGWEDRNLLAAAKLGSMIRPGQCPQDWQAMLLRCDSEHRANDDFIEAHVYEGFNVFAVESVEPAPKKMSRESKLDTRIALEAFQKHLAQRQP